MTPFADSDAVTIAGIFSNMFLLIAAGYFAYLKFKLLNDGQTELKIRATDAATASATAAVASTRAAAHASKLDEKITTITNTVNETADLAASTHTLVNSNMGAVLKTAATALRTVANLDDTPANNHAASEAENALSVHQGNQNTVDRAKTNIMNSAKQNPDRNVP